MSLTLDRLSFALTKTTQSAIARTLGVSPSTISRWSRGISAIPKTAYNSIRNIYQKEAYGALRSVGAPAAHARKFSSYAPSSAIEYITKYENLWDQYTAGAFSTIVMEEDVPVTRDYIDARYDDIRQAVLEGMQRSQKSVEEWEKYKFGGI